MILTAVLILIVAMFLVIGHVLIAEQFNLGLHHVQFDADRYDRIDRMRGKFARGFTITILFLFLVALILINQ